MPPEIHFHGQITQKALIKRGEEFLMVLCSDNGKAAGLWDMPGGRLNEGESPLEGLQREVREEIGAEIVIGNVLGTGVLTNMSNKRSFVVIHAATLLFPETDFVLQSKEVARAEWFSKEAVLDLPIIYPVYFEILKRIWSI